MEFLSPTSLPDALAAKAEHPDAVPIMGGTDVMVELNFDRHRPPALLDLTRVRELATWDRVDGGIRLGAGVTYTRVIDELAAELPGLALASRTVGSPQIRNRGTVGGNLGAASPAGDSHPVLLAVGAEVELSSTSGVRRVPVAEFYTGPKRHAGRPDELITAVWVPVARGPQQFSKIGTRNAMVIAVAAFGLALHPSGRRSAPASGPPGRRRCAPPRPRRSSRASSTGSRGPTSATRWPRSSGGWSPPRPRRSTTYAAPRRTAGTRSRSWPAAAWPGRGPSTGRSGREG